MAAAQQSVHAGSVVLKQIARISTRFHISIKFTVCTCVTITLVLFLR